MSTFSSLGFGGDAASSPDPHAVSKAEAQSYYAGLRSEHVTLMHGQGAVVPAQRCLKELRKAFTHPIAKVWNHDLGWKVVKFMDTHVVS